LHGDEFVHLQNNVPQDSHNHVSIERNIFGFTPLQGVLTESHFTDPDKNDITRKFRLGRFLSFMGAIDFGMGQLQQNRNVHGIAVDDGTALAIDPNGVNAKVYGTKHVWFGWLPSGVGNQYDFVSNGQGKIHLLAAQAPTNGMAASAVALLRDPARHRAMATAARERVADRFCADRVVPMYEAVYAAAVRSVGAKR
jgi:hypothetical protein